MTKRELLYNKFSENLNWVKKNSTIRFEPDLTDSYICPLCFRGFTRESLFVKTIAELTLDHNPPESLGGRETVLTCRECNSKCGHLIDHHLSKRLDEMEALNLRPNSSKKIILRKDGLDNAAILDIDHEGVLNIKLQKGRTNPYNSEKFISKLKKENWEGFKFNMNFKIQSLDTHVESALLKIAYLKAFMFFGNGFLVHPFLNPIRNRIFNPEDTVITQPIGLQFNSPEKPKGIAIVSEPRELQSFVVCFELINKSKRYYFTIILPGFTDPGLKVYENLKNLNSASSVNFKLNFLSDKKYVEDEQLVFASQSLWKAGISC